MLTCVWSPSSNMKIYLTLVTTAAGEKNKTHNSSPYVDDMFVDGVAPHSVYFYYVFKHQIKSSLTFI